MKKAFFLIVPLFLCMAAAFSQSGANRAKHFNLEKGLAIKGFDPVSYFNSPKPIKGVKEIAAIYNGVTYFFSNEENKKLFLASPAKYEPQYGGWCAFAMGDTGEKVDIDPKTFKLINGKLYLFYNAFFRNTLKSWNKNERNLKTNADLNWAKIVK